MIIPQYTLKAQVISGLLFVFLFLAHISASAQLFVEEGLDRGFDAVISTQGLGGPGVSSIDFDQDGDDDLTIGSNGDVLFYQNNDAQFQLIELDIETPPGEVRGVIWTDINNDGNLDLLISSYQGEFRLHKNIGNLEFEDITGSCGIAADEAANWGISTSDINRDGFVDLQLCRYRDWFTIPENPSMQPELWTRLYLNNGDETFTDYTIDGGLVIDPGPVFLGAFFDFNNDLWPDNHTIVDRFPGNRLFVNGEGSFTDITEEYGVSFPENDIMSNSISDYDNDGYLDIFMTNNGAANSPTYLLKNDQGESFNNVTSSAGVEVFDFTWGAIWIDANNDGWQDLFFGSQVNGPNHFFLSDQGIFTDQSGEMQLDDDVPSYSAAKGDYDNDGYYDMIVQSRGPDRSLLLMNQGGDNNFIKITPHGTVSNSMAIGSWVKVYVNGSQYVHYTLCGEGYISQNSQHLIFGLGEATSVVDSVTVWYPSGHTDSYYNLPSDSAYHFYEGETYLVDIIPDDTLLCEGDQVLLDAGEHLSYMWNTGDTTRFIYGNTTGVYSVMVTNEFGIVASNNIDINFQPNPIITETISPNSCLGDSMATINLENLLNTAADSVFWNNGMVGNTIDSLISGNYTYTFMDVNGCASSGSISVVDPPELLVFATSNPADVGQANGSIVLTIFGGISPYVIFFEGETVDASISDLAAGEYTFSVTDAFGCTRIVAVIVESTLGATRNKLAEILSIYPNPTSDLVEIKSKSTISRVSVYDSSGILVREFDSVGSLINLENLTSGLYLLKVELVNSDIGLFRIVKD